VLQSADILALGMLERYLKAVDSAGLDRDRSKSSSIARSRQNDDEPVAKSEKDLVGRYRDLAARIMSAHAPEAQSRADSPVA
jgi:hypothetical protein